LRRRCGAPGDDRERVRRRADPARRATCDGRDSRARRAAGAAMGDGAGFDELIPPATRLSIVALLAAADWADFAFIRDELTLSDSALSKQLSTLEDAGYVVIDRTHTHTR